MESDLKRVVEALLFAAPDPLSVERMKSIVPRSDKRSLKEALAELVAEYDEQGHAFQLVEMGGGWRVTTRPEYSQRIEEMLKGQRRVRLSKAALEVLSVVAYRQPCTRVDVDEVRGVNSGGSMATLLDRGLVRITGRSESLGRPLLYGTTEEFLSYMGINSIEDLPNLTEIEALLAVPQGDREEDTPIAAEERRLRLVEGMESLSEYMGTEVESAPDGDAEDEPRDVNEDEAEPAIAAEQGEQAVEAVASETEDAPEADVEADAAAAEAAMPSDEVDEDEPLLEDAEHIRLLQEGREREVADLTAAPDIVGDLTGGEPVDSASGDEPESEERAAAATEEEVAVAAATRSEEASA